LCAPAGWEPDDDGVSTLGRVRIWSDEQGWGVIDSAATPGGCWTHFSQVLVEGYRSLRPGQAVIYEWEVAEQDGYSYRTVRAWPADAEPVQSATPSSPPSAYRSSLTITFGAVTIRAATGQDLEAILVLADARRREYAAYQPVFWRLAADAIAQQRPHLAALIDDEAVITLVAVTDQEVVGFAVGTLVPAPPVYDPGGPTCLVDDFTVADPNDWPTVGAHLLRAVGRHAAQRGAAQIVVITAHLDQPKRAMLTASGLSTASEWWVGALSRE